MHPKNRLRILRAWPFYFYFIRGDGSFKLGSVSLFPIDNLITAGVDCFRIK